MGHSDRVISVACGTEGTICSSANDKTVKIWKPEADDAVVMKGHDAPVTASCWPEGNASYAVTGSSDGVIKLWYIGDGVGNVESLCTLQVQNMSFQLRVKFFMNFGQYNTFIISNSFYYRLTKKLWIV